MVSDDPESFADLDGHCNTSQPDLSNCGNPINGIPTCICAAPQQQSGQNASQQQSAAQQIADRAKAHGDKHDPGLAAKLALLDAADKGVTAVGAAAKKEVSAGVSADAGPIGIDEKGNISIKSPAEWKEVGASIDIKIHAPSEEDTAGEVTFPGKHLGLGTNLTNDGTAQGLNIKIGVGSPVGPELSTNVTTVQKIKNFFSAGFEAYGKMLNACGASCAMTPQP